jgi:hypothetical protein
MAELSLQTLHDRMVKRWEDLATAEDRGLNQTALERMYQAYLTAFHVYKATLEAAKSKGGDHAA